MAPEAAHRLTIKMLQWGLGALVATPVPDPPVLRTRFLGMDLPNPVGLAAGFDKNAEVPAAMSRLGFGFVEIGTVTPRPQAGNARPRLFRLTEDRAVINRMGFNNDGAERVAKRLAAGLPDGVIGVNLGANKDSSDRIADYVRGLQVFDGLADYFVINISSPNTPGLRDLQRGDALNSLLEALQEARARLSRPPPPLLVKIAPDLLDRDLEAICATALAQGVDGLVISNTTLTRPETLKNPHRQQEGGLSGAPLLAPSTKMLAKAYLATGGALPLVGVGGIASGRDVFDKLRAGASAVQLYSALVFAGPGLIGEIKRDLASLLTEAGAASPQDITGADAGHFAGG